MSVKTLGTNATNSIAKALAYLQGGLAQADVANLNNAIKNDQGNLHEIVHGFSGNGLLYVPNRGVLKILPGDWVGVDTAGWPILVSAYSIANSAWTHS